ncbi:CCN family member 1-like, partial [Homarus americanus]
VRWWDSWTVSDGVSPPGKVEGLLDCKVVGPPDCERVSGRWSRCSLQKCGAGVSLRWSTDNARCQLVNQTRLCQLRPCQDRRQQQLTSPYLQPDPQKGPCLKTLIIDGIALVHELSTSSKIC